MLLKVTELPLQIVVPGLADIDTDGVAELTTVMVSLLLLAVVVVAQLALLVSTQVKTSPLLMEEAV